MITAQVGLPGSGKSYSIVAHVIKPALEKGREVYSNVPINKEAFSQLGVQTRSFHDLPSFSDVAEASEYWPTIPAGAVIIIDEAWRYWPSGLKANHIPEHEKSFFTEHRHRVSQDGDSQEIFLVTQDLSQVCAFVRNLVETTNRAAKASKLGFKNAFKLERYHGCVTGNRPSKNQLIESNWCKYDPEVFKLYQSHTMSETLGQVNESDLDDRSEKTSPFKKLGLVAVCLVALTGFGLWQVTSNFSQDKNDPSESALVEAPNEVKAASKPRQTTPVKTNVAEPKFVSNLHPSFRLLGFITKPGSRSGVAMIENSRGNTFNIDFEQFCSLVRGFKGVAECMIDGLIVNDLSGQGEIESEGDLSVSVF